MVRARTSPQAIHPYLSRDITALVDKNIYLYICKAAEGIKSWRTTTQNIQLVYETIRALLIKWLTSDSRTIHSIWSTPLEESEESIRKGEWIKSFFSPIYLRNTVLIKRYKCIGVNTIIKKNITEQTKKQTNKQTTATKNTA